MSYDINPISSMYYISFNHIKDYIMNNTKQGFVAGQSTRVALNKGTHITVEATKTVTTTVSGFIKGFFSDPTAPAPKAKRIARSAKSTK